MSAAKKKKSEPVEKPPELVPSWPVRIFVHYWQWTVTFVAIVAMIGVGSLIWQRVRPAVFADHSFQLDGQSIQLTPQPNWIHADIKAEVMRNSNLAGLSILDDGLAQRLAEAFALHPWIEHVEQVVKKFPSGAQVDVVYRRPIAMVEVPGGVLPVDAAGTLLPSDNFSPVEAKRYPRIAGIESSPRGPVGTNWGDAGVAGGAKIAETLSDSWTELGLNQVRWFSRSLRDASSDFDYALVTKSGVRIVWGSAPAVSPATEPSPAEKLARLKAYVQLHGSLDESQKRHDLDLRLLGGSERAAAAAQSEGNLQR